MAEIKPRANCTDFSGNRPACQLFIKDAELKSMGHFFGNARLLLSQQVRLIQFREHKSFWIRFGPSRTQPTMGLNLSGPISSRRSRKKLLKFSIKRRNLINGDAIVWLLSGRNPWEVLMESPGRPSELFAINVLWRKLLISHNPNFF